MVQTDGGTVRRNRHHLTVVPNTPVTQHQEQNTNVALPSPVPTRSNIVTRSKTGTVIRPPQRFRRGNVGHERHVRRTLTLLGTKTLVVIVMSYCVIILCIYNNNHY